MELERCTLALSATIVKDPRKKGGRSVDIIISFACALAKEN